MTDIKWQAPPASKKRSDNSKWPAIFDALRERPGQWAVLVEGASGSAVAGQIKRGKYAGSTRGEFEAISRTRDDGKFDIYARYVEVSA